MKIKDFFKGFKEGQKLFGETISIIFNSIALAIVYFIGIGLTSIFARLFGKRFLEKTINRNTTTYWQELNLSKKPIEDYYRQF